MAGKRSTAAEKGFRVNRVARMLANAAVRSEIIQYAAEKWGVSERTADEYIRAAREVLSKDWEIDRRVFTAELLSQLASLQKEARKTNQPNIALGCINSAARLAQLIS